MEIWCGGPVYLHYWAALVSPGGGHQGSPVTGDGHRGAVRAVHNGGPHGLVIRGVVEGRALQERLQLPSGSGGQLGS